MTEEEIFGRMVRYFETETDIQTLFAILRNGLHEQGLLRYGDENEITLSEVQRNLENMQRAERIKASL